MEQSGFPFPAFRQGGYSGPLVYVTRDTLTLIKSSVRQIITTIPGERAWLPEFGCNAPKLVFEGATSSNMDAIASTVYEALTRWEPRIRVTPSDIVVRNYSGRIHVTVSYTLRVAIKSGQTQDSLTVIY